MDDDVSEILSSTVASAAAPAMHVRRKNGREGEGVRDGGRGRGGEGYGEGERHLKVEEDLMVLVKHC